MDISNKLYIYHYKIQTGNRCSAIQIIAQNMILSLKC